MEDDDPLLSPGPPLPRQDIRVKRPDSFYDRHYELVRQRVGVRQVPDLRIAALSFLTTKGDDMMAALRANGEMNAEGRVSMMAKSIKRADLWWVASDMLRLLEAAAPNMPSQPLMPSDPPSNSGFVVFETPLSGIDSLLPGRSVPINAMLWTKVHDNKSASLDIECFTILMTQKGEFTLPVGGTQWYLGEELSNGLETEIEDRRRMAAFWTLSQQERLASTTRQPLERHAAKRQTRAGLEPSDLRIVRLRKFHRPTGETHEGDIEYSHRWIVSGHWRNQYLPSRGTHRVQWIAPHIKGPDDKPLIVKDTVKAWVA